MYSRSYYNEENESQRPPENYNGTVFIEKESAAPIEEPSTESSKVMAEGKSGGGFFRGLPRSIPLPAFLGRLGLSSLSMPEIGTEEILIIAAAAYLFFSKDGDKECAIILLLLLFVS